MAQNKQQFNVYKELNLSDVNKQVLARWQEEGLFERSIKERQGAPSFVFFEGPPSANGMPGIHHVMARTIKDIFCRYKTMKGFCVKRKAGWDTHGLPVELGVERSLGITKEDIGKRISVDDYNAACRREVMKFTREWETLTSRMGYWVDMNDPYITYDNRYIESVWWLLGQLYQKGYLYKGYTIQPYSPAAGTGLSSHELNQPGCYRDVKDMTATAIFPIIDAPAAWQSHGTPVFLAWTTTPWTLPSNTALCVGPAIDYAVVQTFNPYTGAPITAVMAEARLSAYLKPEGADAPMDSFTPGGKVVPYRIIDRCSGQSLLGMRYSQLMPWVKPCARIDSIAPEWVKDAAKAAPQKCFTVGKDSFVELADEAFRVISGDYVTTDDGTGIVHIAPTFGADDAKVAKAAHIPSLFMITRSGETRPMVDLTGKFYTLSECAPAFVEHCVDVPLYSRHQGAPVKNAFDPRFNRGGSYDADAAAKEPDLNVTLCLEMKQAGEAFKVEKHVHNYPHCWRTDKPVIYYPLDSWFIRTTAARERLMDLNRSIKWKPEATGTGRFGKWLENLQDWNLSRSRYWGTPLPIWRTDDASEELCISSLEQLYAEIDRAVDAGLMPANPYKERGFIPGDYSRENYERIDLHRPYVDRIVLLSPSGKPMHRETDLIDVWFDSGSMPFAQQHYPFENKQGVESGELFPAHFIAEGVDQTRGWFFTLHAIAGMVFDSVAYRAVISNGLVLDKNGNKMSKRLGNAVDPFKTIEETGSDPLRWYMIANSSPWDNLKFDPEGIREVTRKLFATLHNTYGFLALYANVDGFDGSLPQVPPAERPEIDRQILSLLHSLIREVDDALADYEPTRAARAINEFVIDNLSNWYVRLNRKRFWGGEMTPDKLAAYQTLYSCLETVALLIAPIAPFYADRLYRDLRTATGHEPQSVHLAPFPTPQESLICPALERNLLTARAITSLVLALRRKVNIKVRQPLQAVIVPVATPEQKAAVEAVAPLIESEVNVKELKIAASTDGMFVKRIRPDFKKLGPKHGKNMKAVAAALTSLPQDLINSLETAGSITIDAAGVPAVIDKADVEIIFQDIPGWQVASDGRFTIALDVTLTPGLRLEGLARELVNRIQNIRKARDYSITDRIKVIIDARDSQELAAAVAAWGGYIASQVLAEDVVSAPVSPDDPGAETIDMDGLTLRLAITR